jgi:hypothetical protein
MQGEPSGYGLPPGLAAEQAAEHLGRARGPAEDELGWGRPGPLPAEVARDPQRGTPVGQGGVRGQAVEDDDVGQLIHTPTVNSER